MLCYYDNPSPDQSQYNTDLSHYICTYRTAIGNIKIQFKVSITGNRKVF